MDRVGSVLLMTILLPLTAAGAGAQESGQQSAAVESARATLARWVETQQIISREREDWQIGSEVLKQRIDLLEREIATIEQGLAEVRTSTGEADRKKAELVAEERKLAEAAGVPEESIGPFENRTRELLLTLPQPLRERVALLSQRLPADPAQTELSLGQRFQNVIGILNEVNKFNRDLTVAHEVLELPDGTRAEVRSLYVGLGQAYYVTADGGAAGVGHAAGGAWSWRPADDLAPQVARAIAILQNEEVPDYVPLPVDLR
jgi:hypothetical protein